MLQAFEWRAAPLASTVREPRVDTYDGNLGDPIVARLLAGSLQSRRRSMQPSACKPSCVMPCSAPTFHSLVNSTRSSMGVPG